MLKHWDPLFLCIVMQFGHYLISGKLEGHHFDSKVKKWCVTTICTCFKFNAMTSSHHN